MPRPVPVPKGISDLLFRESPVDNGLCAGNGRCLLKWQPGDTAAIAMLDSCGIDPRYPEKRPDTGYCSLNAQAIEQAGDAWREIESAPTSARGARDSRQEELRERAAALAGQIEVRQVQGRQLFINGQPSGPVLR
jgi:hypothetical protein